MVVGVVDQPVRKAKTLFTAEERKAFLDEATVEFGNVKVEVFSNLLVEFAREQGASAVVKGLRAISDFEYEFEMNQLNRKLAPDIESMYIFASRELQLPLLDGVKEMATFGGDVADLVPAPVAKALAERWRVGGATWESQRAPSLRVRRAVSLPELGRSLQFASRSECRDRSGRAVRKL